MTDRPRALFVLVAVFLLGCILGSAGSYVYFRKMAGPERRGMQGFQARTGMGRGSMQNLQNVLRLTPEQQKKFQDIMAESRKQLDKLRTEQEPLFRQLDQLRTEQEPQLEAIRSETNRKLMAVLDEEQQKKFSAFLKQTGNWRMRTPFGGRGLQAPGMRPPPRSP